MIEQGLLAEEELANATTPATGTYKLNVNGTINASGNLTALNFSGSSSGANTGDQMNWLNISSQSGTTAGQRVPGSGVLDLDGDLAPVVPLRPVHLADRGRRGRVVVEPVEAVAPVGTVTLPHSQIATPENGKTLNIEF